MLELMPKVHQRAPDGQVSSPHSVLPGCRLQPPAHVDVSEYGSRGRCTLDSPSVSSKIRDGVVSPADSLTDVSPFVIVSPSPFLSLSLCFSVCGSVCCP